MICPPAWRPSTPAVEPPSRSSTSASSKRFRFGGRTAFEIIGEGFNLTNADNPNTYVASQASTTFGQPTKFAGDFRQSEQRLFQIGARFEF